MRVFPNEKANATYSQVVRDASNYCYNILHPEFQKVAATVTTITTNNDLEAGIKSLQDIIVRYPEADNIHLAKQLLVQFQARKTTRDIQEKERMAQEQQEQE